MGFKYVGNISKLEFEDKTKVIDLTVTKFKELIREIVSEEVAKHFVNVPYPVTPPQPYYYNAEPWSKEYEVTYDTTTTLKNKKKEIK